MQIDTVQDRKTIKKQLLWGDVAKIAELAEVNRITVDRWFLGKNNNQAVATFVQAVIEKRKEKITSKINKL